MAQITIKATKALFASGQTETALQQLMDFTANGNKETHQSAILLRASWEYQKRETINGTLSFEEANIQRNRITKGALDLISDVENEGKIANSTQSGLQQDLLNNQTAALMQAFSNNQISVQTGDDANIIIGQGNTVNKKTVTGFGVRQFLTILLTLILLLGGGYWAYENVFKSQTQTYASLTDIQKELADLTLLNGQLRSTLERDHAEIEALLNKAIKALNNKDYPTAIQYLENVTEKAPISTVYQNIAYAYDKLGNKHKANAALLKEKQSKQQTESYEKFAQNLSGTWVSSEWGNMEIVQMGNVITGHYTHDKGQLKGSIKDNKIVFTWWENLEKGQPYEAATKGERGDGYFNISAESESIKGEWRYDGDTNWKNIWTAKKIN